ncbi:MAG: GlsB/YeaQ/YmgE family stress response membrane protein [Bacteroidaceae bacterium]|nr:GlsB/YeaQ/YmgE family stress response membrane protein [Bacteroidaceae bacterium]
MTGLIGSIIMGCLAGFCAGKLMKGGGFGFLMNLLLGLFGGAVGGWLFSLLGVEWGGLLGQLGTAIIGAVVILWVASLLRGK